MSTYLIAKSCQRIMSDDRSYRTEKLKNFFFKREVIIFANFLPGILRKIMEKLWTEKLLKNKNKLIKFVSQIRLKNN